MKIITKYYDKNLRLRILKDDTKNYNSIIRFKLFKDNHFPCCDYHGTCTNFAYVEVYPMLMKNSKNRGWSYLCKKHYFQEQKRLNWKLPACLKVEW